MVQKEILKGCMCSAADVQGVLDWISQEIISQEHGPLAIYIAVCRSLLRLRDPWTVSRSAIRSFARELVAEAIVDCLEDEDDTTGSAVEIIGVVIQDIAA